MTRREYPEQRRARVARVRRARTSAIASISQTREWIRGLCLRVDAHLRTVAEQDRAKVEGEARVALVGAESAHTFGVAMDVPK